MKIHKSRLILAVASAYAVLPGCGDDSEPREESVLDAGGIVLPPNDAGPRFDAGRGMDAGPGPDAGLIVLPPHDAGCVPDAAVDGGCDPRQS